MCALTYLNADIKCNCDSQEIEKLDPAINENLHNIWKSYISYNENSREHKEDFCVYQKVIHAWENLGCPDGDYFKRTSELGDCVITKLKTWMMKCVIKGNQFYYTRFWTYEMESLLVNLFVKGDKSTGIPFLYGIGVLTKFENADPFGCILVDHPTEMTRIPAGYFYFLTG